MHRIKRARAKHFAFSRNPRQIRRHILFDSVTSARFLSELCEKPFLSFFSAKSLRLCASALSFSYPCLNSAHKSSRVQSSQRIELPLHRIHQGPCVAGVTPCVEAT